MRPRVSRRSRSHSRSDWMSVGLSRITSSFLRSERSVTQDVRLQRIVTLDSVLVLARRSRYREFEEHRKRSGFGTFLTEEDIERRTRQHHEAPHFKKDE